MKGYPARVRNIGSDLDSMRSVLNKLENAPKPPKHTGVFSLEGKDEEF